jgi:Na+/H+ antiporter NhaA
VPAAIVLLIELIKGKRIQLALKVFIMTFLVVLPVMLILIIVVTYTYVIEIDTNGIYSYNPHNSWKRECLKMSLG